jgi:hypothetical protein
MKKRIISVMAVLAMLCGPAMMQIAEAQNIFESNEDLKKSLRGSSDEEENDVISLEDRDGDISLENFAPLSGGILVLGCLGGAYLIGKRRKE